jgi:hypothetical protein
MHLLQRRMPMHTPRGAQTHRRPGGSVTRIFSHRAPATNRCTRHNGMNGRVVAQ